MAIEAVPVTYNVMDFVRWQKDGTLDLRPPFQRNAVWRPVLKSSLIDSLLRGYPIPALFLQDRTDSSAMTRRLVVVDGQQRLRTILSYVDIDCLPDRDDRDVFALLPVHDEARAGLRFSELNEQDRRLILESRLNVYTVGSTVSEGELLEIFRRMNTYGAQLNAQELRNAKFSGMFKELTYKLSAESVDRWLDWGVFNRQQIAEMRDAEFTSDLLLLLLRGRSSSTVKTIDAAYTDFEADVPHLQALTDRFQWIRDYLGDVVYFKEDLPRFKTRMWAYSLFDAIQTLAFTSPLEAPRSRRVPAKPNRARVAAGLAVVHRAILEGTLPEHVASAIRGAANDAASRKARATYLLDQLS